MNSYSKDEIRKTFQEKRSKLSDKQKKSFNRDIVRNFYSHFSLSPKSVIAGYLPAGDEADISLLLEMYAEDGHIICLPCVDEKDAPMIFREYRFGAPLVRNKFFNFLEPPYNFKEVLPDIIITPLVAFDSAGNRIGMGKGFYDRTFDNLNGFKDFIAVGVGYSCQQAPFIRPDQFDFQLHSCVTENKVFTFDDQAR